MTATISSPAGAPHARIMSVGSYRPERVVTNAEVCELIDSTDEWIRERSGIVERRYAWSLSEFGSIITSTSLSSLG